MHARFVAHKTAWKLLTGCLCLLSGAAFAHVAAAEDPKIVIQENVVYGTGGGEELTLHLAMPDGGESRPCILVIHGGGWAAGNKDVHREQIKMFAEHGYVSASIGYRLAPTHKFPAAVEDVKCAARFLRAHAADYKLNPEQIGAIGFSAGAHLAMMLGVMDKDDGLEGEGGWADQSSKVKAVVAFFGPVDLMMEYPDTSKQIVFNFIGGTKEDKADLYRQASPVTYVDEGDAELLIFQGTNDPLVPHEQAYRMADAMTKAGLTGRVELLLNAAHGWSGEELERTVEGTLDFFEENLK